MGPPPNREPSPSRRSPPTGHFRRKTDYILPLTRARERARGVMLPPAACRLEGAGEPERRQPPSPGPRREAWRRARPMGNRRRPVLTLRYPSAPRGVYARHGPTGGGRIPSSRARTSYVWGGGKPRQRGNRQRAVGPAHLPARGEADRFLGYSTRGRGRVHRTPPVGPPGRARSDRKNPSRRAGDESRSTEPLPPRIALPAPPLRESARQRRTTVTPRGVMASPPSAPSPRGGVGRDDAPRPGSGPWRL